MKKLFKKLSLLYVCLIVGFVLLGQMMVDNGILTKAEIFCNGGKCDVAEESLLSGKVFRQFSFHQADVESMWLKEDLRGYYRLWSSFDKVESCSGCDDQNLIHFPFSWWWKNSADSFVYRLKTQTEIQYSQYNRSFSWLGSVLLAATVLVLVLYKFGKVK